MAQFSFRLKVKVSRIEVTTEGPPDAETTALIDRTEALCGQLSGRRLRLDSSLYADTVAALEQLASVAARSRARSIDRRQGR